VSVVVRVRVRVCGGVGVGGEGGGTGREELSVERKGGGRVRGSEV